MATDADEETTACIARLLQEDANQLAWVRGESPERRKKNADDDDDDYAPSGAAAKRRKAGEPKAAAAPKAPKAPKAPRPPKAAAAAPRRGAPGVTLGDLVRCGKLAPGLAALTSLYKGETYTADLGPSGAIHFRGSFFQNVSSFSLHVKRLTAPDRKADDGWTAVRHRGRPLADIKAEALAQGLIPGYEATGAAAAGDDEDGDDVDGDGDAEDAPVPIPAPPKLPAAPAEAPAPPRRASEGAARIIAAASPRRPSPPRAGSPEAAGAATEYVRARPQRQRLAPQRLAPNADDQPLADDLQLVTAAPYADEAADAAAAADDVAPLHVTVSSSAALVMDFHSHLSGAEVIGFLGGRWDASTRQLRVLRALPAAQLVSGDAAVEVELDPAGMPALLERLETEGLAVVGWYHSHPTFATQPSVRDIGNQGNYQRLFADAPFVGAIVGPWDAADDRGAADMRWFHVTPAPAAPGGSRPRQLAARPEPEARVGAADVEAGALEPALEDAAREAAGRFAGSLMRTDFGSTWRTATAERPAMTRRDKLAASLRARIPEGADEAGRAAAEALVQRLLGVLDAAWAEHA